MPKRIDLIIYYYFIGTYLPAYGSVKIIIINTKLYYVIAAEIDRVIIKIVCEAVHSVYILLI